jgi:hypothetical protein
VADRLNAFPDKYEQENASALDPAGARRDFARVMFEYLTQDLVHPLLSSKPEVPMSLEAFNKTMPDLYAETINDSKILPPLVINHGTHQ